MKIHLISKIVCILVIILIVLVVYTHINGTSFSSSKIEISYSEISPPILKKYGITSIQLVKPAYCVSFQYDDNAEFYLIGKLRQECITDLFKELALSPSRMTSNGNFPIYGIPYEKLAENNITIPDKVLSDFNLYAKKTSTNKNLNDPQLYWVPNNERIESKVIFTTNYVLYWLFGKFCG